MKKQMTPRAFCLALCGVLGGLLLLCASVVLVIDPAFQYHKPLDCLHYAYESERYQNAGFAKNFDYDTVVIGSSVTSNYRTTWFDEAFGGQAVKLSFPGGTFEDFDRALDTVFATHTVDKVFISLDPRLLKNAPTSAQPLPEYLWDTSPWNDIAYLLNKDVLLKLCVPTLLDTLTDQYTPVEEAFVFDDTYTYDLQKAIASYNRPPQSSVERPADYYDANLALNWAIIDSWLAEHPEVTFYLYYPPYSTLFLDTVMREGEVEPTFSLIESTALRYMHQENVRFYSFIDDNPITTVYDNYTDMVHYSPEINHLLVQKMATEPPMDDAALWKAINDMRSLTIRYDFDSLFPDNYAQK